VIRARLSVGLLAALALVAGACGRSGTSSPTTAASSATSTTAATAKAGDFGTLSSVCGPGNATGATDKGVTNTGIDVGTMADPGATVSPGLDQELFDASTTFVKWCNAQGGILGRQINLHLLDSALFNVKARMTDACAQDFSLVGGGTAFDDSGVDTRVACGLPDIPGYTNTPKASNAPLQVQPTPYPTQQGVVSQFLGFKHSFPGELKAGFLVGNLASVVVTKNRYKEGAQDVGFNVVYDETYPVVGLTGAESYVQRMKAAGVQMLMMVSDDTALVSLLKGMQTVGWYPDAIVESANNYKSTVWKNAGSAVKNVWVAIGFAPFEAAGQVPAVKQFLDLSQQYNPSGIVSALSINSWNAWLMFAKAAAACGSNLTRACLLQKGGSYTDWTGGGIEGPVSTNFANRQAQQCYAIVKASPTGFTVDNTFLPPNQGIYNCSPDNVVTLKGSYSS
jgi:hypothetical protein